MPSSETKPTSFEAAFHMFVQRSLEHKDSSTGRDSDSDEHGDVGVEETSTHQPQEAELVVKETGVVEPGVKELEVAKPEVAEPKVTEPKATEPEVVQSGPLEMVSRGRGRCRGRGRGRGVKRSLVGGGGTSPAEPDDRPAGGGPTAKRGRAGRGRSRGRATAATVAIPSHDSSSEATAVADSDSQDVSVGRRRSSRRSKARSIDFKQLLSSEDEDDPVARLDSEAARLSDSASDEWVPMQADDPVSSGDEASSESQQLLQQQRRGRRPGGAAANGGELTTTSNSNTPARDVAQVVHGTKPSPPPPVVRSHSDKKPQTGDFLVAVEDANLDSPPLWRIDGKFLIQKYEPIKGKGQRLYKNMATYMSWTSNTDKFRTVSVRYHQMGRSEIIVELLDNPHCASFNLIKAKSVEETTKYLENFEIYMQTLISQALDANFLLEIIREGDEYFMKNVNVIKEVNEQRRKKIIELKAWDQNTQDRLESLPCLELVLLRNVPPSECAVCHQVANARLVQLYGRAYDPTSLQPAGPAAAEHPTRRQFSMCSFCAGLADLYHKVVHQTYHLYLRCSEQVTARRADAPDDDSTNILNVILADETWLSKTFSDVQTVWGDIDQIYTAAKEDEKDVNKETGGDS